MILWMPWWLRRLLTGLAGDVEYSSDQLERVGDQLERIGDQLERIANAMEQRPPATVSAVRWHVGTPTRED